MFPGLTSLTGIGRHFFGGGEGGIEDVVGGAMSLERQYVWLFLLLLKVAEQFAHSLMLFLDRLLN